MPALPPLEIKSDERPDSRAGSHDAAAGTTGACHVDLDTPTHRGDIVAASLCLISGLSGYLVLVPAAVYVPSRFAGSVNSPAFFPNLLFVILTALGALYLVQSLAAYRGSAAQGRTRASDWALAAGTASICAGYVAAIYIVGMTIASAICVAAAIFYFGERRPWVIVPTAIVLPALLWFFFVEVAHVLFPTPLVPVMDLIVSAVSGDGARATALTR